MDNITFYKVGFPAGLIASHRISECIGPDFTAYFFTITLFLLLSIPMWDDKTGQDRKLKKAAFKPLVMATVILFAGLAQTGM
ncbi:MAG: hypothetical protein ACKO0Z_27955 [Betaproteobacteria bacterium]